MPRKPIQFTLRTLVWLIIASAVFFGTIRYIQTTTCNVFGVLLAATCFVGPLLWLLCRPNPFRGRTRNAAVRCEPAGPFEHRLQQFMINVAPIEPPTASDSTTTTIMPEDSS